MRSRVLASLSALCGLFLIADVSSASAASYTWTGGSGNWGDPSHWISNPAAPGTIPGPSDDVSIPGPGTFTVLINAYMGGGAGRNARSLTLGDNTTGTQEVLIKTDQDTLYGSGLTVGTTTTIAPHGQITLDQDTRSGPGLNKPSLQFDGDATNQGTVLARTEGAGGEPYITGAGTLVNTGTLHVQSGRLQTRKITNTGTIVTDPGATLHASSTGGLGRGVTMNGGTITNNGAFVADGDTWLQNGGTLTGNPVNIDGPSLVDVAGTGTFLLTHGVTVTGTVPAGQTLLLGERAVEQTNVMSIGASGLTIAQGGTLLVQGPPANGIGIEGSGQLTVDGTLRVAMPRAATAGTNDRTYLKGGLTVNPTGLVDLTPGSWLVFSPNLSPRPTWTNNGTIAIPAGSELRLDLYDGDTFTNNGTVQLGIASAAQFGRIVSSGAPATVLGGTAAPILTGGYVPPIGTAFKVVDAKVRSGNFATVTGGFTSTVAADGTSASLIYGGAPATPILLPAPDRTAPVLKAVRATASGVRLTSSEAAKVTIKVTRSVSGRRVKGKCEALRPSNRRKPRCTRTLTVATKTKTIAAGTSTIALPKLARGTYTVTVTATDAAGNKAKSTKAKLVVKATKKKR